MPGLADLDATAQAELVSRGEAEPRDLVEAAIDRIERHDPELGAVVTPLFELARAAAAAPELPAGRFRGVPFLLKDLGSEAAHTPHYEGMGALSRRAHKSQRDSYVTALFRSAGFILAGKSATCELGLLPTTEPLALGPTRNPYDPAMSAGGSSGGAAASVAAGLVPVAHGTDGGGSIRIPAACCGLVGLKPSRGRISLGPRQSEIGTGLGTEGVITRSVRDAAGILDVLARPMPGDPCPLSPPREPFVTSVGRPPPRLRIAVWRGFVSPSGARELASPACQAAADEIARVLSTAGHRITEAPYPALDHAAFPRLFQKVWGAVAGAGLRHWSRVLGSPLEAEDVEPTTWRLAELGAAQSAADYLHTCAELQTAARQSAAIWDDFDVVLTPALAQPPLPLGQFFDPDTALDRAARLSPFTAPFNVSGEPAIAIPAGKTRGDLPIGVQLAAPLGREDLLLSIAGVIERARPFAHPATRA